MADRDFVRLLHIRDAISRIEEYAAVGHQRFLTETMTQDAIIWQLEVMCEAVKRLSPELRKKHPSLTSASMGELHHEFEHNFLTFDRQLAWKVTQDTLPEIKRTVEAVLEATPRAKTA